MLMISAVAYITTNKLSKYANIDDQCISALVVSVVYFDCMNKRSNKMDMKNEECNVQLLLITNFNSIRIENSATFIYILRITYKLGTESSIYLSDGI